MKLIAKWKPDQNPAFEEPNIIVWEDGSLATLDDFGQHAESTYSLVLNRKGEIEKHIYPDIFAHVVFERAVNDWVVKGAEVITAALDLNNIAASDDEIYAALATFPMVYRAKIIRPSNAEVTRVA